MEIAGPVIQFLLPVLAAVLTLGITVLLKRLADKWGLEKSEKVDELIDKYVPIGVNYAEKLANNYFKTSNEKLAGSVKKANAISVVLKELEQSGVRDVAQELISSRIEAFLQSKDEGN